MISILITLFHLAVIIACSWWIYSKASTKNNTFWPALILRLGAGICLGLLYTFYYPVADTFAYFSDGSKLSALARTNLLSYAKLMLFNDGLEAAGLTMLEPRAVFLTKVTSVFNIFTLDNYWAISLYYSAISFLGAWSLVVVIRRNIPFVSSAAKVAFLFVPSIVFWTSGLLKESLAMAALFFLSAVFLKLWFRNTVLWWEILLLVFAFWVFWNLKYYYAGVFLAVSMTGILFKKMIHPRIQMSAGMESVVWLAMLVFPVVLVTFLHPNFNLDRLASVIVSNNQAYNILSDPGDYVRFQSLNAEPVSLLRNAPWALLSGLFRPFFWEASSILQLLQGVENAVLLLLFVGALFRFKRFLYSPHRLLILSTVAFIVITAVFITMSAPNFGTLSRYRVGYVSFFTFLILCDNPIRSYLERYFSGLPGFNRKS